MNIAVDQLTFEGARSHSVTADEYCRMVDAGVFGDRHVELVEGELIEMAPSDRPHATLAIRLGSKLYNRYAESEWLLFADAYVGVAPRSVRAPDISIVSRSEDDGERLSGRTVFFAVEISHSTLSEDLNRKRRDYALAGIQFYWVVDVEGRRVHRFAGPVGSDYLEHEVSTFTDPLPLPGIDAEITID